MINFEPNWNLIVTLLVVGGGQMAAGLKAYYGIISSVDKARTDAQRALDLAERSFEKRLSDDRAANKDEIAKALVHVTQEIARIDKSLDANTNRLHIVETGSDEMTRSLRERVHKLADQVQVLVLKVDRVEHLPMLKGVLE